MQKLKEVFKVFHDKKGKYLINILAIILGIIGLIRATLNNMW